MVQIKWTQQALLELKEIHEYIAKDSTHYARLVVLKIKARTLILKSNLLLGSKVQELGRDDIRQLVHGNYRIIYKVVNKERADILTVHHAARDFTSREIVES
jgi:toxin ParE1/3/4